MTKPINEMSDSELREHLDEIRKERLIRSQGRKSKKVKGEPKAIRPDKKPKPPTVNPEDISGIVWE